MKDISTIRRTVVTMANQLHKLGYSLSNAFKTAWRRIKASMTCRVSGVTYQNRQQCLEFLKQFKPEDLSITLEREPDNTYDSSAVKIVVHICPLSKKNGYWLSAKGAVPGIGSSY